MEKAATVFAWLLICMLVVMIACNLVQFPVTYGIGTMQDAGYAEGAEIPYERIINAPGDALKLAACYYNALQISLESNGIPVRYLYYHDKHPSSVVLFDKSLWWPGGELKFTVSNVTGRVSVTRESHE